jgi:hypothetical protein
VCGAIKFENVVLLVERKEGERERVADCSPDVSIIQFKCIDF